MTVENDFLAFAVGGSANVIPQSTYAADTTLLQGGFQAGIATSAQLNKVWRQSSIMAAVMAQFIVARTGSAAIDDGTTATLLANLELSTAAVNGDSTQTFSVAPATLSTHAAQLGQFASSLGVNGYITIPTIVAGVQKNLIVQFGQTGGASSSGPTTVTYPVAFPNGLYGVTLGAVGSGDANFPSVDGTPGISSFPFSVWNVSGSRASSLGCSYIAIGH